MQKWEYLVVEIIGAAPLKQAKINGYGSEGWELVTLDSNSTTFYFKRPIRN